MLYFIKNAILLNKDGLPKNTFDKLDKLIYEFVSQIEEFNFINKSLKRQILENATSWNKNEIMEDLERQVNIFRSYDTEKGTQFPYRQFIGKFFE